MKSEDAAEAGATPAGARGRTEPGAARDGSRMPVLFVGHGNPMNAIRDNAWSTAWRAMAHDLARPKAILAISAHWYVQGTYTLTSPRPRTIHDFGGFPRELYEVEYPAAGDPGLAERVARLLKPHDAKPTQAWGLDHGTWSVLVHTHPKADSPVVQLGINALAPPADHLAMGRLLAPLRDEGVLILASGNLTHNLRHAFAQMQAGDDSVPDWSRAFDRDAARALKGHDADFLASAPQTEDGRACHPTLDHYLPLLYAAGAADSSDKVSFPVEGFDSGLSMRAIRFG